mmetsp:Transcript_63394/g.125395  ORF Transcript_63394/g.125395 Transcript_63394/m.125395 type:complete len:98 (-) Transcript_63394:375-668(-)
MRWADRDPANLLPARAAQTVPKVDQDSAGGNWGEADPEALALDAKRVSASTYGQRGAADLAVQAARALVAIAGPAVGVALVVGQVWQVAGKVSPVAG